MNGTLSLHITFLSMEKLTGMDAVAFPRGTAAVVVGGW